MDILHVLSDQPVLDDKTGAWKIKAHTVSWLLFEDPEVAEKIIEQSRVRAESFTLDELTESRKLDYDT